MLHSVYLSSVAHLFFLHVLDCIDLGHLYIYANKNFALFPSTAFQSVYFSLPLNSYFMINYCDSISLYKQINKPTSIVCRLISVTVRTIWSDCCRQKVFRTLLGWTALISVSAFFLALRWAGVSAELLAPAPASIQHWGLCGLSLQWDTCLPGGLLSSPTAKTNRSEMAAFWCLEEIRTPACSHQFTSFKPLCSVCYEASENSLCFRIRAICSSIHQNCGTKGAQRFQISI